MAPNGTFSNESRLKMNVLFGSFVLYREPPVVIDTSS
jgi:hypothetical protein